MNPENSAETLDRLCAQETELWPKLACHLDRAWSDAIFGLGIRDLLIAIVIFFGFLIIRKLFSRFVIASAKRLARRTETTLDDEILASIEAPLALVPIIIGTFFAGEYLIGVQPALADPWSGILARIVQSLISFAIFWGLFNAVEPASHVLKKLERLLTRSMMEWIVKALKLVFVALGAGAVLEIWGIPVGPLIASLGLFGVAVALGAQDLFKNLIGGLSILIERRFKTGDWILVSGTVEGTVEQIGFRSTIVRRFDKAPVFVPNDALSNSAVTNFSEMTHRRIYWKIGVEYRTSVDQLRQIRDQIETYVLDSEDFADPTEVATFVRIDSFSDSSIDIMLYCFTITTDWGKWLEIKEQLAYAIKQIVEGAGSGFAFPSQSLYVESLPGDGPEVFIPPTEKS
jgi:MscS family membrane protein